jgi:hypothetical protein
MLTEISQILQSLLRQRDRRGGDLEREVEFTFDQTGNRELPHIMGDLPCCRATGGKARIPRAASATCATPTLERPARLRSLPDRRFQRGLAHHLGARRGLLGRRSPVNVGRNNFDRRRYTYFQDDNAIWEAFKKGGYPGFPPRTVLRAGPRNMTSRPSRAAPSSSANSPAAPAADAGLRLQHAQGALRRPARASGADLCLRFRRT